MMNPGRLLALGVVLLVAASAGATVANPGFETGNLNGWLIRSGGSGSTAVTGSAGQWSAIQGNYFALLRSDGPTSSDYALLHQQMLLKAGDQVQFQYFWDVAPGANGASAVVILFKGDTVVPVVNLNSSNTTDWGQWETALSGYVPATGDYRLRIEAANGGSGWAILGIDDVRVIDGNGPAGHAPEPLTISAAALGLVGLAGYIRSRKRS